MNPWGWTDPHGGLWARDHPHSFDSDFGNGGNGVGGGGSGGGAGQEFAFQANGTSQTAILNELRFQAARSIRTSTIILAIFNVVAAFATILGILWDSYVTKKRDDPKFKFRTSGFTFVGPTETFPLALSIGIVIQGTVFAIAQSTGLDSLFQIGCALTSQMMLPAVFIVPYIQFVLGLEVTSRALRRRPFSPKGKWTTASCVAIIGTLLLASFLVTHFVYPPNFCFGSLFWFVQRWKKGIFIVMIIIAVTLIICIGVIFWRLHAGCDIDDPVERDASSRMVYYLAFAVISICFSLPFFYSLIFMDLRTSGNQPLNFSMMASVVANLSGLMTGGLHLFLRSSCLTTFGPRDKYGEPRDKLKADIRVHKSDGYGDGFGDDNGMGQRWSAGSGLASSWYGKGDQEEKRVESPSGTPTYDGPNPLRVHELYAGTPQLRVPEPTQPPSAFQTLKEHIRKSSYSLFPRENKTFTLLPATTYSPNASSSGRKPQDEDGQLLAPPPLVLDTGLRHRRDSSMGSHATVQIGLRFSKAEDAPPINSPIYRDSGEVHNLGCPKQREIGGSKRPSPLGVGENGDDGDDTLVVFSSKGDSVKSIASRPTTPSSQGRVPDEPKLTLTAAVYNPSPLKPSRVITSPQGVGFNVQKSLPPPPPPARCYKPNCDCEGLHKAEWI
ncbi:hypothetical protein SODALDRAFT_33012 [Sodiomyces alkalinus F11]|uniref:Uncharacterized protein n=1 Tax=Sodiomyces alkalinus (strain CBS 110278 / VKM F-3762 / F11) TaxID=1314773 RepID=A0A3N2Q8Y2_SODAK|nr:hypothetical protein SODALDRAFT_33012 [Sodiomyces alkalinus F11]ROT43186.1 hypothetical protein SODALDRAFT_33012 [Sodiomyces alkalinus F11]